MFSYPLVVLLGGKFYQPLTEETEGSSLRTKICLKRTLPQGLPGSPFEFKTAHDLEKSLSWIERRGWVVNAS